MQREHGMAKRGPQHTANRSKLKGAKMATPKKSTKTKKKAVDPTDAERLAELVGQVLDENVSTLEAAESLGVEEIVIVKAVQAHLDKQK
jgi:hypothetical protein